MDLLSSSDPYVLTGTGQGLQRVQPCPRTHKAMQEILYLTQREVKVSALCCCDCAAVSGLESFLYTLHRDRSK
jgi:Protein of unknown function (DUF2009)